MMQTEAPVRKAGGRLSREDQRRLGDILQRVYDDVVKQGVPDRFKTLVNELGESRSRQDEHNARPNGVEHGRDGGEDDEHGHFVEAKGLGDHSKG